MLHKIKDIEYFLHNIQITNFFEYIKISKKFLSSYTSYALQINIKNIQWYIVPKFLQLRQYQLNISFHPPYIITSISRNERVRIIQIPCKGGCKKSFQWMNSPLKGTPWGRDIWMCECRKDGMENSVKIAWKGVSDRGMIYIYIKDPWDNKGEVEEEVGVRGKGRIRSWGEKCLLLVRPCSPSLLRKQCRENILWWV